MTHQTTRKSAEGPTQWDGGPHPADQVIAHHSSMNQMTRKAVLSLHPSEARQGRQD